MTVRPENSRASIRAAATKFFVEFEASTGVRSIFEKALEPETESRWVRVVINPAPGSFTATVWVCARSDPEGFGVDEVTDLLIGFADEQKRTAGYLDGSNSIVWDRVDDGETIERPEDGLLMKSVTFRGWVPEATIG